MVKLVGKRGDTLIEVMLAVGIFSMVAVAVVAVMSSGTSSAQTALETTLAREEIDAQAEALRFIQGAYITDKNTGSAGKYTELWKEITKKAIVINGAGPTGVSEDRAGEILNYAPTSCSSLYDSEGEVQKYGFIINTKKIGIFDNYEDVLRTSSLVAADTYPHLTFLDQNGSEGNLIKGGDTFYNAQGIYIIAVRDPGTVIIGGKEEKQSAYFDFYIRTCWYGTGDQVSSNISTVIRLYDPDAIKEIAPASLYTIDYNYNNQKDTITNELTKQLLSPTRTGYDFKGWECARNTTLVYDGGTPIDVNELKKCASNNIISLNPIWEEDGDWYTIHYLNGSDEYETTKFYKNSNSLNIISDQPRRPNYVFTGWVCNITNNYSSGQVISDVSEFINKCKRTVDGKDIILRASWRMPKIIIDSSGLKKYYEAYLYIKNTEETINMAISSCDKTDQNCSGKIEIDFDSGYTYYFIVHGTSIGAHPVGTVRVRIEGIGNVLFSSDKGAGGAFWNVFKIYNGSINGPSSSVKYTAFWPAFELNYW